MIRVGNAPCSWGVLEMSEVVLASPTDMLREMRDAGYEGTELGDWGVLPTDPHELEAILAEHQLALIAGFVPLPFARGEVSSESALRAAHLLARVGGDRALVVLSDDNATAAERSMNAGRTRPEHQLTADEMQIFAGAVERVAAQVREETGLRSVFHPHGGGYVETPAEIDALMAASDPTLVGLCLDTGHITFGGGAPLELLRRYRQRVWHVHFKDCDPQVIADAAGRDYLQLVAASVFCELGQGAVPFAEVVEDLRYAGYDGWIVVEQDVLPGMGTPAESAGRNRAFLRELGL